MSGFPTRPALGDFGPITLINSGPVRNPDTDVDAAHWNLLKHQVAGLGLTAPRIIAKLTVANPALLLVHAEAWNPQSKTSAPFTAPVPLFISTGRMTLTYTTPVTDEAGNDVAIAFTWAHAFQHLDPPTTLKHFRATPIASTPNSITITSWSAVSALESGNTCWLLAG